MWTLHYLMLALAVTASAVSLRVLPQPPGTLAESQDGQRSPNDTEHTSISYHSGLHFSQTRIEGGPFPSSLSPGQVFYRLLVNSPDASGRRIRFRVLAPKMLVTIDQGTGELSLAQNLNDSGHDLSKGFRVEVEASDDSSRSARAVIEFTSVIQQSEARCETPSREHCFAAAFPEQITIASDDRADTPVMYMFTPLQRSCNTTAKYTFPDADLLTYDETTHTVRTTRRIASSDPARQSLTISCQLADDPSGRVFNHSVTLASAPLEAPTGMRAEKPSCDIIAYGNRNLACTLHAVNINPNGKFSARLVNDDLRLFKVKSKIEFKDSEKYRRVVIDVSAIQGASFYPNIYYNFDVIVEEVSTNPMSSPSQVTFHVNVANHSLIDHPLNLSNAQSSANVTAGLSAIYSRVIPALHLHGTDRYEFSAHRQFWHSAFAVTPKEGIVYLVNPSLLNRLVDQTILLRVNISPNKSHPSFNESIDNVTHHDISVTIHQANEVATCSNKGYAVVLCSGSKSQEACDASCGIGAPNAYCVWGQGETTFFGIEQRPVNVSYLSCSPDLSHCPDQYCDELEDKYGHLCPQDCSYNKNVIAVQSSHPNRGIPADATDVCWCDTTNHCSCDTAQSEGKVDAGRRTRRVEERQKQGAEGGTRQGNSTLPPHPRLCGPKGCANLLKVVGLGGMLVVLSVVAIFITLRRSSMAGPQKDSSLKRDSPATPDIPAVYDPELSGAFDSPDVKLLAMTGANERWEVRRENLLFENLLGEGEFGKVMRAQAWNIGGRDGYSTVAVKMLKDNASGQDAQDLLQELQTLKEVDHVNVIKLLGACTTPDEPLFVIVEYCELGSLRSYLRRCRNISSIEDLHAVQNPTYLGEDPRTQLPSTRQLISFMWQIARGMSYLSSIKVIHRDLATRNILVARDNVIKISDFGLSRDVYEGDTYLKRSRQKVPVKWMALESLEDQIYTTKSDVWSFGVVLWEIVTLGATPYPGICGELLCQFLKEGYRMFPPQNCSSQLYGLMRDCWNADPNKRPSFKVLAQKFDRLLQDTTVYLDVEDGMATCSTYYNDESVTSDERDRVRSDDDESPRESTGLDEQQQPELQQHLLFQQQQQQQHEPRQHHQQLHPLLLQQQELQLQLQQQQQQQQQRIDKEKEAERAARVEAQLEGGVVRSHLLLKRSSTGGCSSSEYLNDDERSRLLHYAKMDFARSASESVSSDQEQTSSV